MPTPSHGSDDDQMELAIAGFRACAQEAIRFLIEDENLPGKLTFFFLFQRTWMLFDHAPRSAHLIPRADNRRLPKASRHEMKVNS